MSRILIIIILVLAIFLIGSLVTAQQKISTNSKKSPIEISYGKWYRMAQE